MPATIFMRSLEVSIATLPLT